MLSKDEAQEIWKAQGMAKAATFTPEAGIGCGHEYKYDWNPADRYPNIFPTTTDIKVNTTVTSTPVSKELSIADLLEIVDLLDQLEVITSNSSLFDIQLRVQLKDGGAWVVLGFADDGSPSLLRIEP